MYGLLAQELLKPARVRDSVGLGIVVEVDELLALFSLLSGKPCNPRGEFRVGEAGAVDTVMKTYIPKGANCW